jgi:intracellular sulfur oxidation DsrE/DsrF family protein
MTSLIKRPILVLALITVAVFATAGCATGDAAPNSQRPSTTEATTADQANRANKAVIGVRTPRHMKVALLTARQMHEGVGGYQAEQVAIVACGGAVDSLVKGGGLDEELERALEQDYVSVVACGLTVEHKGIDPDTFVSGVDVVPNGFIELARLQALGYQSIEL